MAERKITISLTKSRESAGDSRLNALLERARKISFSRLMATEPQHIKLPIPASIILTTSGEFYLFVFTVRNGEGIDQAVYAKTAELFGPLNPDENFSKQVFLRYGWADVQGHDEMAQVYERLDSLDVSFYYVLDFRDFLSSQSAALEAVKNQDMKTLRQICPPWEMA